MKFYIPVFLILLSLVGMGQDLIIKTEGEVLEVQYLNQDNRFIYYKKFDDLKGPTYKIEVQKVKDVMFSSNEDDFKGEVLGAEKLHIWPPDFATFELPAIEVKDTIDLYIEDSRIALSQESVVEFSSAELIQAVITLLKEKGAKLNLVYSTNEALSSNNGLLLSYQAYDAILRPGYWHTRTRCLVSTVKNRTSHTRQWEFTEDSKNTRSEEDARKYLSKTFEKVMIEIIISANDYLEY